MKPSGIFRKVNGSVLIPVLISAAVVIGSGLVVLQLIAANRRAAIIAAGNVTNSTLSQMLGSALNDNIVCPQTLTVLGSAAGKTPSNPLIGSLPPFPMPAGTIIRISVNVGGGPAQTIQNGASQLKPIGLPNYQVANFYLSVSQEMPLSPAGNRVIKAYAFVQGVAIAGDTQILLSEVPITPRGFQIELSPAQLGAPVQCGAPIVVVANPAPPPPPPPPPACGVITKDGGPRGPNPPSAVLTTLVILLLPVFLSFLLRKRGFVQARGRKPSL